jgi:hypothetical protein
MTAAISRNFGDPRSGMRARRIMETCGQICVLGLVPLRYASEMTRPARSNFSKTLLPVIKGSATIHQTNMFVQGENYNIRLKIQLGALEFFHFYLSPTLNIWLHQ